MLKNRRKCRQQGELARLPHRKGMATFLLPLMCSLALQGCGLPHNGPMLNDVTAANQRNDIQLVEVTPELASANREPDRATFPPTFLATRPIDYDTLAVGDGVQIAIWERDGLDIFPAGPTGISDLGEQVIDMTGAINLPYIGQVKAQGLTTAQLHDVLMHRLSRIVSGADVSVRRSDRHGQLVTIQGNLAKPGTYPIAQGTERLSGLLSLAAPIQDNPEQLAITLRRDGVTGTVRLTDIYSDPAEDIALRPNDSVIVHAIDQRLIVLGATGIQGRIKLTKRNYSVLDALGDSRGLIDTAANPHAVFLFRSHSAAEAAAPDSRPTVYQFDFTKPEQMMLAGEFRVLDGDAIFISDASFTQVQKVLSTFSSTLSTARSVGDLAQ